MKLSKAVKEYISEQIRVKAENSKRIEELRIKADEKSKELHEDVKLFYDEVDKMIDSFCRKYGMNEDRVGYNTIDCEWHLPEVMAYKAAKEELKEKQRLAELNIIATMELGGNKADLMKMLEELQF